MYHHIKKTIKIINKSISDKKSAFSLVIKGYSKVFEVDVALIAIGRELNTNGLGLENIGITIGSKGSSIEDALNIFYPHPSLPEGIQECLRSLSNRSIYKPKAFPKFIYTREWKPE